MDDRYPHIRFVTDAAHVIAGSVAALVFFGGTMRSCHIGGLRGVGAFGVTVGVAAIAYVIVMVKLEVLRLLLDIEGHGRHAQPAHGTTPPPTFPT